MVNHSHRHFKRIIQQPHSTQEHQLIHVQSPQKQR